MKKYFNPVKNENMTAQEIHDIIKAQFSDAVLEVKIEGARDPFIKILPEKIKDVAQFVRDHAQMKFDYLMCLSGVDYKGKLGVVYHLYSLTHGHKIVLKVEVSTDTPNVPSVESIWKSANWHEREAFDLFGIHFEGHSDLRRILLPDDWEGHPLRKDYEVPEFYNGMKVPY
ncbi:MAG: NADH-quinone oxidoreductase subunit C [Bacteroidota bacterium]|nr:NADH-quinone oxidoreductase subunit C [Bacteroidota bacterium]